MSLSVAVLPFQCRYPKRFRPGLGGAFPAPAGQDRGGAHGRLHAGRDPESRKGKVFVPVINISYC